MGFAGDCFLPLLFVLKRNCRVEGRARWGKEQGVCRWGLGCYCLRAARRRFLRNVRCFWRMPRSPFCAIALDRGGSG